MKQVDFKAQDEKVYEIEKMTGMLFQNRLMSLAGKLGAKIVSQPWWDGGSNNGSINLPDNETTINQKSFEIRMTPDGFRPTHLNGIMTVLHELGHMLDWKQHKGCRAMILDKGYHNIEVEAWENAFQLAHRIGFRDFDAMYEVAMRSLYSYFGTTGTPAPHRFDRHFRYMGQRVSWMEAQARIFNSYRKAKKTVAEVLHAV
jgi:hypothetical protein